MGSAPPPWLYIHMVWTARTRSGLPCLTNLAAFVAAIADRPEPERASLAVREDLGPKLKELTREVESTPARAARALELIDYRPGPLAEAAIAQFGPGQHRPWASGATGFLYAWEWAWQAPVALPPLVEFYAAHEASARGSGAAQLAVDVHYQFAPHHPATRAPLSPTSRLTSWASVSLERRSTAIGLRIDRPEPTPAFWADYHAVMALLGGKPPRHVVDQIIPARTEAGRERRIRLTPPPP